MGEFINRAEGERLLIVLESGITANRKRPNMFPQPGEHPLYEFKSTKSGNNYSYPVIQEVFDLLAQNKYGGSYVPQSAQDLKNEFRANLTSLSPEWIEKLEPAKFDEMIYFFNYQNSKGLNTIHYIPERLCDGTIHAMLKRAMEIGKFEKPVYKPQQAASGPSTPQMG